tara:strand:- start:471 stop:914 length:444 start_codon:yes stop_codon:yes gene_type:complete
MKLIKEHVLFGVLNSAEELNILQNTLPNHGWRIVDFRIFPNSPSDVTTGPDTGKSAKLSTIPGARTNFYDYMLNTTVGVASYCGGVQSNIIDTSTLIVNDLFILNMNDNPGVSNSGVSYQVVLEQYDISDDEQVLAIIRENSQAIDG